MNILLIGNGFDLAHGLKTTYMDFLDFCTKAKVAVSKNFADKVLEKLLYDNKDLSSTLEKINIVKKYLWNNKWLSYFLDVTNNLGENWIDFEKEILKVVQSLDDFKRNADTSNPIFKKFISDLDISKIESKELSFESIISGLEKDLVGLIQILEIYLTHLQSDKIQPLADIQKLKIDKVLSFNYTNTYELIYGKSNPNIEYDYIHGKADVNNTIETNNMVLGINEYLPDDRKNIDMDFLAFKKYFQRIYKMTGSKYLKWVATIKDSVIVEYDLPILNTDVKKHNLYIYGHSLDITDGDILKSLICNDNVQSTIFYHSRNSYRQLITNLIKIIGQDELIRRTGGPTKTIEFRETTKQ